MSGLMIPAQADPAVIDRLLTQSGALRTPAEPEWAGYFLALAEALMRWLGQLGAPLGRYGGLAARAVPWLVWLLLALVAAQLALLVARRLRGARARRPSVLAEATESDAVPAAQDLDSWREELERRLAAGAVGEILEALWWWFACAVTGRSDVTRASTSRELVARAGRSDLTGETRALDRCLYGPRRPDVSELRALFGRLRQALQ